MNKRRVALFLRFDQIEKLQKIGDQTGAPMAELVRRAIDAWLKEKGKL